MIGIMFGRLLRTNSSGLQSGSSKLRMNLTRLFTDNKPETGYRREEATEAESKRSETSIGDRGQKPQMSEFDKFNEQQIRSQTRDTNQPFKVQQRDQKSAKDSNLMNDRSNRLNLKQFEIAKEGEVGFDAVYERPRGVMDFIDRRFSRKQGITLLTSRQITG